MTFAQFLLYEAASGYCLLEVVEGDAQASLRSEGSKTINDLARFSKLVKLKAFQVCIIRIIYERLG